MVIRSAALLAALFVGVVDSFVGINSMVGRQASIEGDSKLIIYGYGFQRGGLDGSTFVYVGAQPCDVVDYHTTDTVVECRTRPAPPGQEEKSLDVSVYTVAPTEAGQATSSGFYYREWATPHISSIHAETVSGAEMLIKGDFKNDEYEVINAFLGGYRCMLLSDEEQSEDRRWTIRCEVQDLLEAGEYNLTVTTDPANQETDNAYGRARYEMGAVQVNPKTGTVFTTVVAPLVESVSPTTSGSLGGGNVTITGTSFSEAPANITVTLDGVPCEVLESSRNQIVCKAGAKGVASVNPNGWTRPTGPFSPGPRGLAYKKYDRDVNTLGDAVFKDSNFEEGGVYMYDLDSPVTGNNFAEELLGYFEPPFTGTYRFLCSGDDVVEVMLSTSEDPANLAPACSVFQNTNSYYDLEVPDQRGSPVSLTAGQKYFFRARHWESWGGEGMKIAAVIENAASSPASWPAAFVEATSPRAVKVIRVVEDPASNDTCAGFYDISVDGVSVGTGGAQWNATDGAVENIFSTLGHEVNAFEGPTRGDVRRKYVLFETAGANPTVAVTPISLVGCTVSVTDIQGPTPTAATVDPLPVHWFRKAVKGDAPVVDVVVNGIVAEHTAAKADSVELSAEFFSYNPALDVAATAVSPTTVTLGTSLSVTLSNLPGGITADGVKVFVGPAPCAVTSLAGSSVTCTVGAGLKGTHAISVLVDGVGLADVSGVPAVTYTVSVSQITPVAGSLAGGAEVTIVGGGFPAAGNETDIAVLVGANPCTVKSSSFDTLVCITPEVPSDIVSNIFVDGIDSGVGYSYETAKTPTVSSVSPAVVPASTSKTVRMSTTGMPDWHYLDGTTNSDANAPVQVNFGNRHCRLLLSNATDVICRLSRADPDYAGDSNLAPSISVYDWGLAKLGAPSLGIESGFKIDSISSSVGSLHGGNKLIIKGAGFSEDANPTGVDAWNIKFAARYTWHSKKWAEIRLPCNVDTATATDSYVECTLASLCELGDPTGKSVQTNDEEAAYKVCSEELELPGVINMTVNGINAECTSCNFTVTPSVTNKVTNMDVTSGKAGDVVTFTMDVAANSNRSAVAEMHLGSKAQVVVPCAAPVYSGSTATVACTVTEFPAAQLAVNLRIAGDGYAAGLETASFTNTLSLSAVLGRAMSVYGGRKIKLEGHGFSSVASENIVKNAAGGMCTVVSSSYSAIECIAPAFDGSWPSSDVEVSDLTVTVSGQDESFWNTGASTSAAGHHHARRLSLTDGKRRLSNLRQLDQEDVILHPAHRMTHAHHRRAMSGAGAMRFNHHDVHGLPECGRWENPEERFDDKAAAWEVQAVSMLNEEFESQRDVLMERRLAEIEVVENAALHDDIDAEEMETRMLGSVSIKGWANHALDQHAKGSRRRRLSTPALPVGLTATSASCTQACDCQLSYAKALTPQVTVSQASTVATYTLEAGSAPLDLSGVDLTTTVSACAAAGETGAPTALTAAVRLLEYEVAVTTPTASTLEADLATFPAGTYENNALGVQATGGFGNIRVTGMITLSASVSTLTGTSSSFEGGAKFSLSGSGFPNSASESEDLKVRVCGHEAEIASVSPTTIEFLTPEVLPKKTLDLLEGQGVVFPTVRLEHSAIIGDSSSGFEKVFDLEESTRSTVSRSGCYFGIDMGTDFLGVVKQISYWPDYGDSDREKYVGGMFQVSSDADHSTATWTTLHTISDKPQEGWNTVSLTATEGRLFRYVPPSSGVGAGFCYMNELKFEGVKTVSQTPNADGSQLSCPVEVSLKVADSTAISTITAPSNLLYATVATPLISSVSPTMGSSLGGETVTLTGSNFGTDTATTTVELNGVPCAVQTATATQVTCVTGARQSTKPFGVTMKFETADRGVALAMDASVDYRYLDRWSDLQTWADFNQPVDGDYVIIPNGQAVLLDEDTPKLGQLLVQGQLIVDRRDIKIDVYYFWMAGGEFELGTEASPFEQKAEIVLRGDRWKNIELPHNIGVKMLVATPNSFWNTQGRIDVHGKPRIRTWTRLDATASAGSNSITLVEPVDWADGEYVVLTHRSSMGKTEVLRVASLSNGGRTVTFYETLQHTHEVERYTHSDGTYKEAYLGCEAGLLSRNVIIHGDELSQAQKFGSHLAAQHGAMLKLENAEIYDCGQQGILGRYCSHWHMPNKLEEAYIRANSIHHSFQRAVTIHAVDYARIQDNVAYHVAGHSIFVEDAIETNNVIEGNLVVFTIRNPVLLSGDMKPASFWTPTPTNIWRHNVAAGSVSWGYWFELVGSPTGPSRGKRANFCPSSESLQEFHNNTAHANSIGLRIYPVYLPKSPACGGSGGSPQWYTDLNSHHNGQGIFHRNVGDVHHRDHQLIENGEAFFWKKFPNMYFDQPANLQHVLAVGDISGSGRSGISAPQFEYWWMDDVTLMNFGNGRALAGCSSCDSDTDFSQGAFTYRTRNMKYPGSNVHVTWRSPFKEIFWDMDGTLTGAGANTFTTPSYEFSAAHPACSAGGSQVDSGIICTVPVRKIEFRDYEPREIARKDIMLYSMAQPDPATPNPDPKNDTVGDGWDGIPFRPRDFSGWAVPAPVGRWYNVTWRSSVQANFQKMKIVYSTKEYVQNSPVDYLSEWMGMTAAFDDHRHHFEVSVPDFNPEFNEPVSDWSSMPNMRIFGLGFNDTTQNYTAADVNDPSLPFGTHVLPEGPENTGPEKGVQMGTWSVMLGTNDIHPNSTIDAFEDPFTLAVKARECPEEGCYAPPPLGNLGAPQNWSDPTAWPMGRLPMEGEDVVIGPTSWIVLDIVPPKLGAMSIQGRLEFSTTHGDLTLQYDTMIVWGQLIIGSPEFPMLSKATLIAHGNERTLDMVVDEGLFLGNKGIAVVGHVIMYGKEYSTTWTRMASSAAAGSSLLSLEGDMVTAGWAVGDEIVIGASEYDFNTVEKKTISVIASDGTTTDITLSTPLSSAHGSVTTTANGETVTLKTPVGHLSRSIEVTGAPDIPGSTYGAHMSVVSMKPYQKRYGQADLNFVQFSNGGKQGREYGALNFDYSLIDLDPAYPAEVRANATNLVKGCSFDLFNYGIIVERTEAVQLLDNVLFNAKRYAIETFRTAVGATITGNLAVGTFRDPEETQNLWLAPYAAFFLNAPAAAVRNNMASGSEDTGFVFVAQNCDSNWAADGSGSAASVSGNEVSGALIGAYMFPEIGQQCARITGWKVWKAAHIGIFAGDTSASIEVDGVVTSDSHIGLSLDQVNSGISWISVKNSLFIGTTSASTCSESTTCRAHDAGDTFATSCNSVFGEGVRRVGIKVPQQTNRAKTCHVDPEGRTMDCRPPTMPTRMCSLPWDGIYGVRGGDRLVMKFEDSAFVNFHASNCGMSDYAIAHSPEQIDYMPELEFERTTFENTDDAAKFSLNTQGCWTGGLGVGHLCDAVGAMVGRDIDGSLLGRGANTVFNPAQAAMAVEDAPACTQDTTLGVNVCPGEVTRMLTFRTLDMDAGRRMVPMTLTREVNGQNKTVAMQGMQKKEPCSLRGHYALVSAPVTPGKEYYVTLAGVNPKSARIHFFSEDPNERILLKFFYVKPMKLHVFRSGEQTRDQTLSYTTHPNITDPHGAHVLDPQERHFYIVLTGAPGASKGTNYVDIRTVPVVQLTMVLDVHEADFSGANLGSNIATLLALDPSRMKVADPERLGFRRLSEDEAAARGLQANTTYVQVVADVEPTGGSTANSDAGMQQQVAQQQSLASSMQGQIAQITNTVAATNGVATVHSITIDAPSNCAGDECGPSIDPSSISFTGDTDPDAGKIGGTVTFTPAYDETDITGYQIWWSTSSGRRLQQTGSSDGTANSMLGAVTLVNGQAVYEYVIPSGTEIPSGATALSVHSANTEGKSSGLYLSFTEDGSNTDGSQGETAETARVGTTTPEEDNNDGVVTEGESPLQDTGVAIALVVGVAVGGAAILLFGVFLYWYFVRRRMRVKTHAFTRRQHSALAISGLEGGRKKSVKPQFSRVGTYEPDSPDSKFEGKDDKDNDKVKQWDFAYQRYLEWAEDQGMAGTGTNKAHQSGDSTPSGEGSPKGGMYSNLASPANVHVTFRDKQASRNFDTGASQYEDSPTRRDSRARGAGLAISDIFKSQNMAKSQKSEHSQVLLESDGPSEVSGDAPQ
uniref:PA14 domain-containing protein n=1 Tax=Chromera velia CCMP2878 TaxID=1169474 RepID=A0A0G4ICS1_9ALVE|eukprot:Cvel_13196.t1-p1 / transcript=Cvel_13196.t1 / gene=Cvel_13196 / organism=Chromera_velia_CCMP2878 / gene_product=Fibrocystin-L, putative / transcript_product=Fibrocystin-L, putative / location=Cvel_scaffold892:41823-57159(-) / protein_length=4113 / sequence_SO=supercontig / SO=protein_coding / is_pseudo=false